MQTPLENVVKSQFAKRKGPVDGAEGGGQRGVRAKEEGKGEGGGRNRETCDWTSLGASCSALLLLLVISFLTESQGEDAESKVLEGHL